ncbi:MAG: hypothetical protein ACO292_10400 [Ilumatobacteraceae bacterium]
MPKKPIDTRKWFDRLQPQTLQIATWLLYLNGLFAAVGLLDSTDWVGAAREIKGLPGLVVGLLVIGAHVGGGFLMANDWRLGYRLALFAAFSPFILRVWVLSDDTFDGGVGLWTKISGNNTISLIFEVALCALLLHPISREHQRRWYR